MQAEEAAAGPSGLQVRSYSWHFVKNFHALAMKLKDVGGNLTLCQDFLIVNYVMLNKKNKAVP